MVVPMFSPRIMAAARRKGMTPVVIRIMMMAMVAAELWKHTVRIMPIMRKMATLPAPHCVQEVRKPSRSGVMRTCAVARSCAKPMKNSAKPMMMLPRSLVRWFFLFCMST